jgi:RimJ/RimL family protein N-acetyltransferase
MIIAENNRILIRPFKEKDIEEYYKIVSDIDVMKFIGDGSSQSIEIATKYVNECIKCYQENGWSRFAVVLKETDELIGFCGFKYYNNSLDFGWRYSKKYWGQGIGSEAAQLVLDYANNSLEFSNIVCICAPENVSSIRIIEKIGFSFEKKIVLNGKKLLQFESQ